MKLKITKVILHALCIAVAVLFILQVSQGGMALMLAACGAFVLFLVVYYTLWKCPHCGKHLGKELNVTKCRHCGKKVDT